MKTRKVEPQTKAMAGIGLSVAVGAAVAPSLFLRTFGVKDPPTGANTETEIDLDTSFKVTKVDIDND